jgi:hypothetical protein
MVKWCNWDFLWPSNHDHASYLLILSLTSNNSINLHTRSSPDFPPFPSWSTIPQNSQHTVNLTNRNSGQNTSPPPVIRTTGKK